MIFHVTCRHSNIITMLNILLILFVLCALCFIFKLILWVQIKQRRVNTLVTSFFRYYNVFSLHDAPTAQVKKFRKTSNIINFIFWLCFLLAIGILMFKSDTFNEMDSSTIKQEQTP